MSTLTKPAATPAGACGRPPADSLGKRIRLGAKNPVGEEVRRELAPREQGCCFPKDTRESRPQLWALPKLRPHVHPSGPQYVPAPGTQRGLVTDE